MKIEIPDWVNPNDTILVFAGQELIAIKEPKSNLKIKTVRCNKCGECCMDVPNNVTPFGSDDEGKCKALKKTEDGWICMAGLQRPFLCMPDPNNVDESTCCIRYRDANLLHK